MGKSRLTIRPHAGTSLVGAVVGVIFAVFAWLGVTEAIFLAVLLSMPAFWSYLKKVTVDRRSGSVTKHGRLPFTSKTRLLIEFDRVVVGCRWEKRVRYEVSLCGRGEPFTIITGQQDACWARRRAQRIADFLTLEIDDPLFRCEIGETVLQGRPEPVTTPEPTNHGSIDETDVLSIPHREVLPISLTFAALGLAGLGLAIYVPHLLTRVLTATLAVPLVLMSLCLGFSGTLIDRRRRKVNKWVLHPRFGREHSLDENCWVSIALWVTQTDKDTSTSRYWVRLDGTREMLSLDSFDSHEPAREFACRVGDFLGLEVRDLPGRTVGYPSADYERERL